MWGEQGDGETQGDPKAPAFFAMAIQAAVRIFDAELREGGGKARFGNDDGYGGGPPEVVFPALARLETKLREECGLVLQRDKTEVFAWGELPEITPPELKRAGVMVDGQFEPGFVCYGIPVGTNAFVSQALWAKATEVERDVEENLFSLTRNRRDLTSLTPPLLTQDTKRHSSYRGRQGQDGLGCVGVAVLGGSCFELQR